MKDLDLQNKVKQLPRNPGVYKFLGYNHEVIYVGKARSLTHRVGQYFQKNLRDGKTKQLVENIADIEYIEVFSELEALLLEAELINRYKPKYNINLKDDKSYLYIAVRKYQDFNTVLTLRKNDILKSDKIFGPFPDSRTTKYIVRAVRRLFPFRDCSQAKFLKYRKLGSPCLYGHIGLCTSPCVGKIDPKRYQENISRIEQFLRGRQKNIVNDLKRKMDAFSRALEYERADEIKRTMRRFEYVQQNFRLPAEFMENPYLVDDIYETALRDLVKFLPNLRDLPQRIECYDVANISGKDAAVSMVVAINGRLEKGEYKKFRIKLTDTPNDFDMLREAFARRFFHETRDNLISWGIPDLVVVDGGKAQVDAAVSVLSELGLNLPVIGLAKKEEKIIIKSKDGLGGSAYGEVLLDRSLEGLKLLQRLRDESHRFARVYHHYLRSRHFV